MTPDTQDLVDLIGSRICHDLISPIGAISNGVELLTMSGNNRGPEIDLITESVESANARIRFFRIAFGTVSATQKFTATETRAILRDVSWGGKIVYDWQPQQDAPRSDVKLVFLLLQCFETAMPRGGRITISRVGEQWAIYGQAERLKIDTGLWRTLTHASEPANLDAAHVHFALAALAASSIRRRLTLENSGDSARVRF